MALGSIGAALEGFGRGKMMRDDMRRRDQDFELRKQELEVRRMEAEAARMGAGRSIEAYDGGGVGGTTFAPQDGGGAASYGGPIPRLKVADPVNSELSPHARAFLNAIATGESAGAYNIRYTPGGGATFDLSSGQHPRIFEKGPHGPSSAAGRYQFTATTWDGIAGRGTPFTEANQDKYAWELAKRDYRAHTKRDLEADLASGRDLDGIMRTLAPTWAAFKGNRGRYAAVYQDSLKRYMGQGATPAQAKQAAAADAEAATTGERFQKQLPAAKGSLSFGRGIEAGSTPATEILKRIRG